MHSKHSLDKIVSFSEYNLFDHLTYVVILTYILVGLILTSQSTAMIMAGRSVHLLDHTFFLGS